MELDNIKLNHSDDLIVTDKFTVPKSEIIDILASNLAALGALLRILDIRPSDQVPTACVTNTGIPVILYNPDFINKHCETKAHVAMLLLHEIYHVLLGHTLKNKVTQIDNLVADAIINAMICLQYDSFGFQSFFMSLYDKSTMPQAFLRPKSRPPRFWQRRKYNQLQTIMGLPWDDLKEIFTDIDANDIKNVVLLGNHDSTSGSSEDILPDVILDSIAQSITEDFEDKVQETQRKQIRELQHKKWKWECRERSARYSQQTDKQEKIKECNKHIGDIDQEINAIKSAGFNASIFVSLLRKRLDISKKRKELEEELRKVAKQSLYSKLEVKLKGMFPKIPETSVIPNFRNRRAIISLINEQYQPFFQNPLRPKDFGAVTIYIDVSGSMDGFIPTIYKLACNCKDYLDETIYLFSNDVRGITKDELLKGVIKTTGGTDDCFLTHALDTHKKKIMVFTDGYLSVSNENKNRLSKAGIKIVAAYTPNHALLPKSIIYSELIMDVDGEVQKIDRGTNEKKKKF